MKKILFIIFLLGFHPSAVYAREQVVAQIGKGKITLNELKEEIREYGKSRSFRQRLLTLTPEGKREILDQLLRRDLFYKAAKEEGIKLDEETEKQLERLRETFIIKKYIIENFKEKPVTEEDLRDYYEKHRQEFIIPEKRKIRQIIVKTKKEAEKILKQLKQGKDFSQLASQYNIDETKERGGELGWVKKGIMVKIFEDVAFKLRKGEISGVVKTQFGYYIIKIEAIEPSEQKKYEDVKIQMKRKIEKRRIKEMEEKLKNKYKVKINYDVLKEISKEGKDSQK